MEPGSGEPRSRPNSITHSEESGKGVKWARLTGPSCTFRLVATCTACTCRAAGLTCRWLARREVGNATVFPCSPLASAITGHVLYVDCGYNVMGV